MLIIAYSLTDFVYDSAFNREEYETVFVLFIKGARTFSYGTILLPMSAYKNYRWHKHTLNGIVCAIMSLNEFAINK